MQLDDTVYGGQKLIENVYAFAGYRFTGQLVELERVAEGPKSWVLPGAEVVRTPLVWQEWNYELENHPDKEWVEFLVRGIRERFRIRHNQERVMLREKTGIMYEGSQHREIISKYLQVEESAGRIHKVKEGVDKVQCSPFGVIPKKGKPGKWRLIMNLSAPDGASVNDGIDKELASVASRQ